MIRFENASLRRGAKPLFAEATLQIYAGDRVGIVGRNGCGKSSLFNVFMGKLGVDSGDIDWPKSWCVSLMAQELYPHQGNARDYVVAGDSKRAELMLKLHEAEKAGDDQDLARIHAALDDISAWQAPINAEQLLSGLGFSVEEFDKSVSEFSGGWRIRLNLARALMERSDLLLLDEPTNHLDMDAIAWLEQWLAQYPGTLLLVSHDRDFLDAVTVKTLWFERERISVYSGTYKDALRQKNERAAQLAALAEKQAAQIAHMEDFVRRFKAKASKAKQAQSRVKALEKMSPIDTVRLDSPFSFRLDTPETFSDPLMTVENVGVGYGTPIVDNIYLSIRAGDRIGVLGMNGAGKSTLLKTLVDEKTLVSGRIVRGEHLSIGYFAQHQVEALDLDVSPLTQLQRLKPEATEQSIRTFLGAFNFMEEAVADNIHHFSGGEKARLALALIAYQKPNLLILDEPTNHLDIEVRDALLLALQMFEGAVVLVSHDRYLLRHSVDQFWLVGNGVVADYSGDLADYQKALVEAGEDASVAEVASADNKKQKRQQAAALRQQMAPLTKALKHAEKQMDTLSAKQAKLEAKLADAEIYNEANKAELTKALADKALIDADLEVAEMAWMDAQEAIESFDVVEQES